VAVGTSLPEIATSIMAAIKGERDIAVGNVVGSNIFNILAVLGLSSAIAPAGVGVSPEALAFDIPVMVGVAVLCFPIFLTGSVISRAEGFLFIFFYVGYISFLVLSSIKSDFLGAYSQMFQVAVLPFVAVFLVIALLRHYLRVKKKVAI
jgi:cation:H+ antiporter